MNAWGEYAIGHMLNIKKLNCNFISYREQMVHIAGFANHKVFYSNVTDVNRFVLYTLYIIIEL